MLIGRVVLALSLVFNLAEPAYAQAAQRRPEGALPYTPSRLEWLAVELNAGGRVDLSEASGFSLDYVPIESENTILIFVRYLPAVNRDAMDIAIDNARSIVALKTKALHWTSWLRVKESIEMAGKPR